MISERKHLIIGNSRRFDFRYIVYYAILIVYSCIAKLWLTIHPVKVRKKKYYLSLCTCFKDESDNLKEWIEYHKLIGVDHFYLYNNNSTDNFREELAPYVEEGSVTLIDFPQTPIQPYCYEHWIENYSEESTFVALTDVDEYFVPLKDCNMKDWLERWKKYPIIIVYWKMFGSSGKLKHDSAKLITEQYKCSWPKLYDCGKIIYNTDYVINPSKGMHHNSVARRRDGRFPFAPVNNWGKFVKYGINRDADKEIDIQLNHYWSGAYGKYVEKQEKGDSAFTNLSFKNFDYFLAHENNNTSIDMSIYRFMIQLKLKMVGKYPVKE